MVKKVYYDRSAQDRPAAAEQSPYSDVIIPQRITCPECGAVDLYEIGGKGHVALTGELLAQPARHRAGGTTSGDDVLELRRFTLRTPVVYCLSNSTLSS